LAQRKKNGRYLDSLIALGDKGRLTSKELSNPSLESTANGFEASVMLNLRDGKHERWRITNDARIKRD
jgi:hypothetical protein